MDHGKLGWCHKRLRIKTRNQDPPYDGVVITCRSDGWWADTGDGMWTGMGNDLEKSLYILYR